MKSKHSFNLVYSNIGGQIEANPPWDVLPVRGLAIGTEAGVHRQGSAVPLGQPPGQTIIPHHIGVVFDVEHWRLPTDPGSIVSGVENACLAQSVSSHQSGHLQRIQFKLVLKVVHNLIIIHCGWGKITHIWSVRRSRAILWIKRLFSGYISLVPLSYSSSSGVDNIKVGNLFTVWTLFVVVLNSFLNCVHSKNCPHVSS